jgi:3',5'-cyclic AMP phosphodiesterase CpdA
MRTLIHITDLHFGKLTTGAVDRLEEQIRLAQPDICIVSGDLTMRSRPREWELARAFLKRLQAPCMVVPGNHDLPYFNLYERFRYPYRRFQKYINKTTDPSYADEEIAVMGINTARSWVPHYTWKEGGISSGQVEKAERFFKRFKNNVLKIVFAHHPFLPPPQRPRTYLVRNARAALEAFERTGVDLLLGGHLHLNYSGDITSFHKLIKRSIIVIQGPTVTSSRLRNKEPNGYNLILTCKDGIKVVSRQWDGTDFIDSENADYQRTATGWTKA